jgi:hypothetical protein
MTIAAIYIDKIKKINQLLPENLNNAVSSPYLGRELKILINSGWNGYENFLPAYYVRFNGQSEDTYEKFSQQVIKLISLNDPDNFERNFDLFLSYYDDIHRQDIYFRDYALRHGFSEACFFLMLRYPDKHFLHMKNSVNNPNPLLRYNVVSPVDETTITNNLPQNDRIELYRRYKNLLCLISKYKKNYGLADNNIDFIKYLEQKCTDIK